MKKAKSKFISLLLIVVMLLNFLPASANATVSDADAQTSTGVTTVPNPDYVEPGSVRELESRREENVKHFLLPDNTVQAVVYADAVHRMDDSGNWQDISNDLSLTEYKGVKFYTTADGRVVFAEKFAPNTQLWQLSENGYSITMGMTQLQLSADATVTPVGGVTVTNAPVRRSATTWHSVEEARVVDNTASIVYANVKTNTDLEYIMIGNDIKENIVVKSRSNSYTYQFDLVLTGLAATQKGDGSISLTDSATGQQQYTIPAPYMVDAAGERSNAVIYALKQTGEGQYALTVTADSTWINADNRAFPVKIDPTVKSDTSFDTYIDAYYPDGNYGYAEEIWVADDTVALFQTYLPTLPTGATLTKAEFVVSYYYHDTVSTGFIYAGAYRMNQTWGEYTYTWNIASQYENLGVSTTLLTLEAFLGDVGAYESSPEQTTFNITSAVQAWYNGMPNNGIAIRYFDGTNGSVILCSNESESTNRPFFTITYAEERLADGVYSLKIAGTNAYLDVRDGGYVAGTAVQQNAMSTSGDGREQLFKIAFLQTVGGDNYYSVRSMTNSQLGLSASLQSANSAVSLESMPVTDYYDPNMGDRMWAIAKNGSSYTLRNGDATQGGYLTGMVGPAETQVHIAQSVTNRGKWDLIPYTGPALHGAFLTNPSLEVVVGSQIQLNVIGYSSTVGVNGPVTFEVYGTNKETTDKATIDFYTGVLTGIKTGTVSVKFTYLGDPIQYRRDVGIKTATCTNVVLKVYYDEAYMNHYENGYDRILNHLYDARDKFLDEFDIWIAFQYPKEFACVGCQCPNKDADGKCQCASEHPCEDSVPNGDGTIDEKTHHHTNYHNIMLHDNEYDIETSFSVRFFYHPNACEAYSVTQDGVTVNGCEPCGKLGYSLSRYGMTAVSPSVDMYMRLETQTLIHELGHIYGAPDHYGSTEPGGPPSTDEINEDNEGPQFNMVCVYGENAEFLNVTKNYNICAGCSAKIMENRGKYNHTS